MLSKASGSVLAHVEALRGPSTRPQAAHSSARRWHRRSSAGMPGGRRRSPTGAGSTAGGHGVAVEVDVAGVVALPLQKRIVAQDDLAPVATHQGSHYVHARPG